MLRLINSVVESLNVEVIFNLCTFKLKKKVPFMKALVLLATSQPGNITGFMLYLLSQSNKLYHQCYRFN